MTKRGFAFVCVRNSRRMIHLTLITYSSVNSDDTFVVESLTVAESLPFCEVPSVLRDVCAAQITSS